MIDVGSVFPADALNIFLVLLDHRANCAEYEHAFHVTASAASRMVAQGECWAVTEIRARSGYMEAS